MNINTKRQTARRLDAMLDDMARDNAMLTRENAELRETLARHGLHHEPVGAPLRSKW